MFFIKTSPGGDRALADAEDQRGGQQERDGHADDREHERLDLLRRQQVVVRLLHLRWTNFLV